MNRTYSLKSPFLGDGNKSVSIAISRDFEMEDDPPLSESINTDKVRAGVTGHHVRYVLGISLALVVIGILIVALVG